MGQKQTIFCLFHPNLVDVYVDIDTGAPLENSAEVRFAAMAESRKVRTLQFGWRCCAGCTPWHGKEWYLHWRCSNEQCFPVRHGYAEESGRSVPGILPPVPGPAAGPPDQWQGRGCRSGKAFWPPPVKRWFLRTAAADASLQLPGIDREESGVYRAQQRIPAVNRHNIFSKTGMADAEVGLFFRSSLSNIPRIMERHCHQCA